MHSSSRVGSFRPGPFGIRDAGAPTIDGLGVIHLEPDLHDAGLVGVDHIVAVETWSRKDELMPEIIVDNLTFPDVLEENHLSFKKGLDVEAIALYTYFTIELSLFSSFHCSGPLFIFVVAGSAGLISYIHK